jgi:DeoR family transcriptional regulator, fructose operon transcriptional repressor
MLAAERHQYLLNQLEQTGSLRITGLERELGVTLMTVWRDLQWLEKRGLLRRVRGGAVRVDGRAEPAFRLKERRAQKQKARIAARAAQTYVAPGDVIMVEGGTTVAEILNHLPAGPLTLMTNSLPILSRAWSLGRGWQLHGSGGTISPVSGNFVGPETVNFFKNKFARTFFMSATGLDPETGSLTDPNPVEIEVKRAMAKSAQRVVLLLDAAKVGIRSLQQVLPLDQLDVAVIDDRLPAATRKKLRALGLKVDVC